MLFGFAVVKLASSHDLKPVILIRVIQKTFDSVVLRRWTELPRVEANLFGQNRLRGTDLTCSRLGSAFARSRRPGRDWKNMRTMGLSVAHAD